MSSKDLNVWVGRGIVTFKKTVPVQGGSYQVTDLFIQIDRNVKGMIKSTLVPLEAWGDMSKACDDINHNDMVEVEGRFENKKWKNASKQEMSKNLIVVEKIQKLR